MTDPTLASPVFFLTPDNFPVAWENPGDARLTWGLDRMHWPAPVTPLSGDLIHLFLESSERTNRRFGLPMRTRICRVNSYIYLASESLGLSAAELGEVQRQSEAFIQAALPGLDRFWPERCLPAIRASQSYWQDFDLAGATRDQLLAHLDETMARVDTLAEMHHEITCLAELSASLFCDLYNDLLEEKPLPGGGENFDAFRLLQGIDQATLQMGRDLWALSRKARQAPAVRAILAEEQPESVYRLLQSTPATRPFLGELRILLQAHGWRSAGQVLELEVPSWREDPTPVIRVLQEYVWQPDRDPRGELDAQAVRRERLESEALRRLAEHPPAVRDQFRLLLKAAQAGVFLSEEHHYWLDCQLTYQIRRVALEFGRRFAEVGALACAEDVFYLTFAQIRRTARETDARRWQNLVSGNRAEMAYFRTVAPPPALGMAPTPGQPGIDLPEPAGEAFLRADERFWGATPQPSDDCRVLRGNPGAAGVARGPARVVRDMNEANRVQKGEILVVEMTIPLWTHLFAVAAAVVTDCGGVLCHSATIAREYGIPAVVGTQTGTRLIRSGQMLEVDGSAGIVRLLPDS